jgi:hypothetical protein
MLAPRKEAVPWSTADELNFIEKIANSAERPLFERIQFLVGYLACAEKRENWGKIDKIHAVKLAETHLDILANTKP